jgi:hypothetical protein
MWAPRLTGEVLSPTAGHYLQGWFRMVGVKRGIVSSKKVRTSTGNKYASVFVRALHDSLNGVIMDKKGGWEVESQPPF